MVYLISSNGLSVQNDGKLGSNVWHAFSKSPVIYLKTKNVNINKRLKLRLFII